MPVVDIKRADEELNMVLAYLDYFAYLPKGAKQNLRAYLNMMKKKVAESTIVLDPKEKQVFGQLVLTNIGTKTVTIRLEVR